MHRLIVNDKVSKVINSESICMVGKYIALHSDLSPKEDSMVLHLTFGELMLQEMPIWVKI